MRLGLAHSACPSNHDLRGILACDNFANGPYALGANIIKMIQLHCVDSGCSEANREVIRLILADQLSRITSEQITTDDSEEKIEPNLN
jgi:hypothetical protein